jgi:hypothetical protein
MDAVLLTDKHLAVMEATTLEKRFKLKITEITSASIKGSGGHPTPLLFLSLWPASLSCPSYSRYYPRPLPACFP